MSRDRAQRFPLESLFNLARMMPWSVRLIVAVGCGVAGYYLGPRYTIFNGRESAMLAGILGFCFMEVLIMSTRIVLYILMVVLGLALAYWAIKGW
jgi:hypothetical protein